jgi:hypothetical protein
MEYNNTEYLMFELVSEEPEFYNDTEYLMFEISVI